MSILTILVVILVVALLCGGLGHANGAVNFAWPGGLLGTVLLILLVLFLLGYR